MPAFVPWQAAAKADEPDGKRIVGWVERVLVMPGAHPVNAKLDTGANTSSIHAESIERFERDGDRWVRFELVLKIRDGGEDRVERVPHEAPLYRRVRIKDHDEPANARPVVELDFCMDGARHRAQFSLADRGGFIYPVLLGRRFLAGAYVIDPDETFESTPSCGAESKDDAPREDAEGSDSSSGSDSVSSSDSFKSSDSFNRSDGSEAS